MNPVKSLKYQCAIQLAHEACCDPDFRSIIVYDKLKRHYVQNHILVDYICEKRDEMFKKRHLLPQCLQKEVESLIRQIVLDVLQWIQFLRACYRSRDYIENFVHESLFTFQGKISIEKAWERTLNDNIIPRFEFRSMMKNLPHGTWNYYMAQLTSVECGAFFARDY